MKQRLGIACAIMEEPKLLLLDEPFNALDKEGQEKLSEIIRDMRDKGSLILLSSHDKDELENLSDVIYLVDSAFFLLIPGKIDFFQGDEVGLMFDFMIEEDG